MLKKDIKKLLEQLVAGSSKEELMWVNGYISGLLADGQVSSVRQGSAAAKLVDNVTVIYATDTGNSKYIAGEITKRLKERSVNVKLKASNQYRLKDLEKEQYVILIISTHGDGEIPESGQKLYDYIHNDDLKLGKFNYFVLALGDSNYPLFCQSGRDFDNRLEELKAKKLAARIDLDLDFEDHLDAVYQQIINMLTTDKSTIVGDVAVLKIAKKSGQHHYIGEVLSNVNLNDIGSDKQTHHIEIACEEEIDYKPGDAIGIILEEGDEHLKKVAPKIKGKIAPRLYSIASSFNEHDGEVHLTVAVLKYIGKDGSEHQGVCSSYLASLKEGQKIKFYISKNRQFKLPDNNKDIIMVGPGTGIAPFRAFLAERNYSGAKGRNWLFFGERNFRNDFLYQIEWQDYLDSKVLTKLNVAFSRDQKHKIYVQDKMQENAQELYDWLEKGAYFYVCGDKEKMAKDVEKCLLKIIAKQGNKTADRAKDYLAELQENDRYLRDVY